MTCTWKPRLIWGSLDNEVHESPYIHKPCKNKKLCRNNDIAFFTLTKTKKLCRYNDIRKKYFSNVTIEKKTNSTRENYGGY